MTPAQKEAIQQHAEAIAAILYADTDPATLNSLENIECTVREKILEHVSPQIGIFYPTLYWHHRRKTAHRQKLYRRISLNGEPGQKARG
jgi:hypothetical protein